MQFSKYFKRCLRRCSIMKSLCFLILMSCLTLVALNHFLVFRNMAPGEMGRPVILPYYLKSQVEALYPVYELNILASNIISENRSLPDMRDKDCKSIKYPKVLAKTSVIIIFHNEAFSTLARTLWSIINRSRIGLVKSIILVDDKSDRDHLAKELEEYVAALPIPTSIIRSESRKGVVHARLLGAAQATTETIIFLDAHCECTEGWLEPLLTRIAEDRRVVACPIIDKISPETFEYMRYEQPEIGGFDWRLDFRWYLVPEHERKRRNYSVTAPIRTPAIAGGIFAIERSYFYEMGSYDPEMFIWGSENIEMSLRIKLCGGILEILPCSRVGHVFRKQTFYKYPGGVANVLARNKWRLAEVWLDEWRSFFYAVEPAIGNIGNVTYPMERYALREKLECKSFRWYLENDYIESNMPIKYRYLGLIQSGQEPSKCLETIGANDNGPVVLVKCNVSRIEQLFLYTEHGLLNSNGRCLYSWHAWGSPSTDRCHVSEKYEHWHYEDDSLRLADSHRCLTYVESKNTLEMYMCSTTGGLHQKWLMNRTFKWQMF